MRHLLTDHARQRLSMRAGGDWMRVTLTDENEELVIDSAEHALALEDAIAKLEKIDARAAKVVELRYFGGLTVERIAETLDVASRTVDRDWRFACAFLRSEIG
jgi:RNA polymerase sigma factor (TIGR02999 family)